MRPLKIKCPESGRQATPGIELCGQYRRADLHYLGVGRGRGCDERIDCTPCGPRSVAADVIHHGGRLVDKPVRYSACRPSGVGAQWGFVSLVSALGALLLKITESLQTWMMQLAVVTARNSPAIEYRLQTEPGHTTFRSACTTAVNAMYRLRSAMWRSIRKPQHPHPTRCGLCKLAPRCREADMQVRTLYSLSWHPSRRRHRSHVARSQSPADSVGHADPPQSVMIHARHPVEHNQVRRTRFRRPRLVASNILASSGSITQ